LCSALSPGAWSRGHHSVYAVELDGVVWKNRAFRERNPGGAAGGCLYIGVTGLTPEQRFERHRAGTQSARFVREHGLRLRLDLVEGFSRLPYRIAACMEPKLAAWLRAQGFAVWQN
jgi:predicted GIY-YIG superfamily endonuclease